MQQKACKEGTDATAQSNAIKANDEAVLKSLYENNYQGVEKYVLSNSGTVDQAKDVYQEAFIAVWRNIQLDKFYPESENALIAYLYQIARNKWTDYLRSKHYKKNTSLNDLVHKLPEEIEEDEDDRFIGNVKIYFEKLGENCKEVLTRFYYKKQSMKKIASRFGWTDASARNNKYRCLQKLREIMKKQTL
jgi:RNA polymerase sigma factor (sigma-70 family)